MGFSTGYQLFITNLNLAIEALAFHIGGMAESNEPYQAWYLSHATDFLIFIFHFSRSYYFPIKITVERPPTKNLF